MWFAFIEQIQYIDKSNASVVEVVSFFATEKARMQEKQSDISSQVKSELRKFSEGKDQDWFIHVRCICIAQVLCFTSGQMDHFFAKFKCFE